MGIIKVKQMWKIMKWKNINKIKKQKIKIKIQPKKEIRAFQVKITKLKKKKMIYIIKKRKNL